MAQSIILKRSALQGKVPTTSSLSLGELAVNTYDGKIYLNRSGSIQSIQEIVTTNVVNTGSITLTKTGSFGELVVSQDGNFQRDLYVTRDIITNGSLDILYDVSASVFLGAIRATNGVISGSSQITSLGFISSSQTINTGSLATTGSNSFKADQQITGSLGVSGDITVLGSVNARQFNIGIISSSILYTSGSTKFGDTTDDTMSVTGSLRVSGSTVFTGSVTAANGFTGSLFGTASFALNGSSNAIMYQTASAASVWTFNHFLSTQYPVVTVYDNTNSVIIPQSITTIDSSSLTITFSSPRTGVAVASKGGYVGSAVGTATVANALTTARLINGTSFDGTQNITIPDLVSGSSQVVGILSSVNQFTASINGWSGSIATTGSNSFNGNQNITGSLFVSGTILQNGGGLALQDGTILYHSSSTWFIPTSTVSTSGTTATSVGTQFTSGMVGAKLTILRESKIITAFTSNTQVTVDSAYSQNYNSIPSGSWGVFSKAFEIKADSTIGYYDKTGTFVFGKRSDSNVLANNLLSNTSDSFYLLANSFGINKNFTINWSDDTSGVNTKSIGLRRNNTGSLEIFDGINVDGAVANRRDLALRNITGSYGKFTSGISAGQLSTPTISTISASSAGGTIPAGTYYYKVAALDYNSTQTPGSTEVSTTVTGSTSNIFLSWSLIQGATSYRVYRSTTSNTYGSYVAVNNGVNGTTFTDTNQAVTSGSIATLNNTGYGFFDASQLRTNNITLVNNGVGQIASLTFEKATDSAAIKVVEYGQDNTTFEFFMADNPDGGDYYNWTFGDWQNASTGWKPLKIGGFTNQFVAQNTNFWSSFNLPSNTPYYTTNQDSIPNSAIKYEPYTSNSYSLVKDNSAGGSGILNVEISGFTGTTNRIYWVTIASSTTFNWGTGNANGTAIGTGVTITGAFQTLDNGVQIKLSAGGHVAGDRWAFRAFPIPRFVIGKSTAGNAPFDLLGNALITGSLGITGSLVVTGSIIATNGITGSIAATNGVVSGSSQILIAGTSDYTSLFSGIASATSSLNSFSASANISITNLNTYSSSVSNSIAQLNTFTSSTAALGSLNSFTASTAIRLTNLEITSASVNISVLNLNTYSASVSNSIGNINAFTSSQTTIESGQNARLSNLETTSASVNISVTNLNTYSASVSNSIGAINVFTASNSNVSLNAATSSYETKGRGIISGSSQLSGTTITDLTVVNLTTINETASVIFSSGSNRFGDFGNDVHSFTGSVQISGSLTITGSVTAANGITGSLLGTASFALNGSSNAVLYQTGSAAAIWTFNHYLQTRHPVIVVYDNTDSIIIPQSISAVDTNTTTITFSSARTGTAVASKGGYVGSVVTSATTATSATSASVAVTASYAISASAAATTFAIGASSTTYGSYVNTIQGANTVITTPTGSFAGAFYNYVVTSGSNARAGQVMAIWNNTTTQFTDVTTNDIGSTTMVTSSVALSAGSAVLSFTTNTNGWNIKTFVTYL
jgi:hypothetical protein